MRSDVSALILAGGRATRLGGIAKHELVVDGTSIFSRQCAVLVPRVAEILVSTRDPIAGFRGVTDRVPGQGPLGGIEAGLASMRTPWLLVVAGDMPQLGGSLIDALLARISAEVDAVSVRVNGAPEPLLSIFARSCGAVVEQMLAAGRRRASSLLTDEGLRVSWLEGDALRAVDPGLRGLRNINSPEDL